MIGTSLSHYHIEAELGRGGMGVVYKARDTKLDRIVAIKVLPSAALASDEDRARFYREAKSAAALTHPHIAIIHGVDEAVPEGAPHGTEPSPFIAMEFIDGETLEQRIAKGPLKLEEATRIASEIASALKMAHDNDIVHRDMKSANVMLTKGGAAKVLDFGLAQTTASTKLTRMGSTLGTVAYMSPEQARGEPVDHRTDIWSLGTILYEMVSGRSAFPGDYEQALVYNILNQDPEPLTAVRTGVPMELERITNKLLAKNASSRYQRCEDVQVDLANLDLASLHSGVRPSVSVEKAGWSGTAVRVAALTVAVLLFLAWWLSVSGDDGHVSSSAPMRLELPLPAFADVTALDVAPNGEFVVYSVRGTEKPVYTYDVLSHEARPVQGTGIAWTVHIAPDGQSTLFSSNRATEHTYFTGGDPIALGGGAGGWDAASAWLSPDKVVLQDDGRLVLHELSSGDRSELTRLDEAENEYRHIWPFVMPDGDTVLFTVEDSNGHFRIGAASASRQLRLRSNFEGGKRPVYVDSGHLLYTVDNNLIARAFDAEDLEFNGAPALVAENVPSHLWGISKAGMLVYRDDYQHSIANGIILDRHRRGGSSTQYRFDRDHYVSLDLNDDGERLLFTYDEQLAPEKAGNIWIGNLETGLLEQITESGTDFYPRWVPNEESIVAIRKLDLENQIVSIPSSSLGLVDVIVSDSVNLSQLDVSPDGTFYVFLRGDALVRYNVDSKDLVELVVDDRTIRQPNISPDGRLVVFDSFSDGVRRLKIVSSDGRGAARLVSSESAFAGQFSPDGKFLFFATLDGVFERAIDLTTGFRQTGEPVLRVNALGNGDQYEFAIVPEDNSLITGADESVAYEHLALKVIVNAFSYLREVAPASK